MSAIPVGAIVPVSVRRNLLGERVDRSIQVLGDERGGFIPVRQLGNGDKSYTLIPASKLNGYLSSPLVKKHGTDKTASITAADQNISKLWQYLTKNPDAEKFFATFDEQGLIKSFTKPGENGELNEGSNAEFVVQGDGTVSLLANNTFKIGEQVDFLNWLLANLKTI
ncbi:MAG: hypothetical protein A3I68_06550 [Candidatus Melainabacteria bacterium RIFCSPLOWO2_02_FULL_35_15]|nr:MAG: hypothetical protein A3F80_00070 [Candidatus Melainabacteria bacterium RIFCSPLOWO2_12_FULL_35_11]OGI13595.1 MAG: hypothetical protein A3I68_06550 [Candidatus Melainabacteria bacterium RIFCSPLOWO2_02_FULL_35_15]